MARLNDSLGIALAGISKKHLLNDGEIYYATGLGCKHHDNCFTCPFDDCIAKSQAYNPVPVVTNADMSTCRDTSTVTMRYPTKRNKNKGVGK